MPDACIPPPLLLLTFSLIPTFFHLTPPCLPFPFFSALSYFSLSPSPPLFCNGFPFMLYTFLFLR
jgi:hypothetical protein